MAQHEERNVKRLTGTVLCRWTSARFGGASVMMTEPRYEEDLTPLFRRRQSSTFDCLQSSSAFRMLVRRPWYEPADWHEPADWQTGSCVRDVPKA